MKKKTTTKTLLAAAIAAAVNAVPAFATTIEPLPPKLTFASCHGDHHGTYLDFVSVNGDVFVETSNDSGEPAVSYHVNRFEKAYKPIDPSGYAAAIREAIRSQESGSMGFTSVFLQATATGGSQLYVEINKWNGKSFVVVDGRAEELKCPVAHVRD